MVIFIALMWKLCLRNQISINRSGAKYVTLSTTIPILAAQMTQILPTDRDLPAIYTLKTKLKDSLNARFDLNSMDVKNEVPFVTCFLDPRFKNLMFLNETQRHTIENRVTSLMEDNEISSGADSVTVASNASSDENSTQTESDSDNDVPRKKKKQGLSALLGTFYQAKACDPQVRRFTV